MISGAYCLVGERLGYSFSARIHRAAGFEYELVEVKRGELGEFVKNCPYRGFNVTVPYKREIVDHLARTEGDAAEIGSVNTVVREGGALVGYNTDRFGMEYSFKREGVAIAGKRVIVLGGGATAKTAEAVCRKMNAKSVSFVTRGDTPDFRDVSGLRAEVVINATPVGTYPECGMPLDPTEIEGLETAFDCVYNPAKTAFSRRAESAGVKAVGGLGMLVAQAVASEALWQNKQVDYRLIEELFEKISNNII